MEYYVKSVISIIESNYHKLTSAEKTVADFLFIIIRTQIFLVVILQNYFIHQKLHCQDLLKK